MPDDVEPSQSKVDVVALVRQWAVEKAIRIAEINRTAEVQKILSDAKRLTDFYMKGPVE